jgi:pyruvate-formate lyase-activating enzyme
MCRVPCNYCFNYETHEPPNVKVKARNKARSVYLPLALDGKKLSS